MAQPGKCPIQKYDMRGISYVLKGQIDIADPSATYLKLNPYLYYVRGISERAQFAELEKVVIRQNEAPFNLSDLSDNQLLILSPLSTDYLMACILQKVVQQFLTPACFRLKPLILSHKFDTLLKPLAIPDPKDPSLAGITRVEIFVETPSPDYWSSTTKMSLKAASIFRRNQEAINT